MYAPLYYLIKGSLYLFSRLPFWVMYRISEVLFVIAFYVVGYRKKVVLDNLQKAFPEKPLQEIKTIRRRFYLHLCDLLVESLKGVTLSARQLEKRMRFDSPEVIDAIAKGGRSAIIIASHYGNFEWTNACIDYHSGPVPTFTIYHELKSPYFERLMRGVRTRWGTQLIPKQTAFRAALRELKGHCMIGFVSDQSPSRRKQLYFSQFLGRPTAMHEGAAMIAVGRNIPAYFADVRKIKRGYYSCTLVPIPTSTYAATKDVHGFTDHHAAMLEAVIREEPAYWLWSHRRWKHAPREGDVVGGTKH